jgi:hypothetical protein
MRNEYPMTQAGHCAAVTKLNVSSKEVQDPINGGAN